MPAALFQPFPMQSGRAAQLWRHQPAYRRPRHFHAEPEINLVANGTAQLGIGDRIVTLSAGELVAFEPGQDHVLLEASPDLELFALALRPELAARVQGHRPFVFNRKLALAECELDPICEQALALGHVKDTLPVERSVVDIFTALAARPRYSDATSRRAVGALRAAPRVTGSELGERLRAAPSRVSRQFHRDLGLTLVEYRARLRLMRFVQLVDAGLPLGHAALEADFGSYAQCHRVFRRALGCGPREYFAGVRIRVSEATAPEGHPKDGR